MQTPPTYFNHPKFSDLQLILKDPDGQTLALHVHKVILAKTSEFFQGLLDGGFKEAQQNQITIEVPNLGTAQKLLDWMYASHRYLPDELFELAQQWLIPAAINEVANEEIPYPGKITNFFSRAGSLDKPSIVPVDPLVSRGTVLVCTRSRSVEFHGETMLGFPMGSIRYFQIDLLDDGTWRLEIGFYGPRLGNPVAYLKYFNQYGILMYLRDDYNSTYQSQNQREFRILLKILLRHNQFREDDRAFIESIANGTYEISPVISNH